MKILSVVAELASKNSGRSSDVKGVCDSGGGAALVDREHGLVEWLDTTAALAAFELADGNEGGCAGSSTGVGSGDGFTHVGLCVCRMVFKFRNSPSNSCIFVFIF